MKRIAYNLCFLLILASSGCVSERKWLFLPRNVQDERLIFVVNLGWHTGIAFRVSDLADILPLLPNHFRSYSFIEIGWGDHDFYQARGLHLGYLLKAILWPTESVIHVAAMKKHPSEFFASSEVIPVKVSLRGLDSVINSIISSFKKVQGKPISLGQGLYGDSRFYEAKGSFSLAFTCNSWTAQVLKSGGLPMRSSWTFTAGQVMSDVIDGKDRYRCCSEP